MAKKVWMPPAMADAVENAAAAKCKTARKAGTAKVVRRARAAAGTRPGFQMKITLKGSSPKIWRRVVVRADLSFRDLHDVIQVVMGWDNCHLHQFNVGGIFVGPAGEDCGGGRYMDEARTGIGGLGVGAKNKFLYEYDFGDSWLHEILVEKEVDDAPPNPVCLAGEMACPPEDCGGLWGYYDLVDALKNPKHPSHEEMKEWHEGFDYEAFDRESVTRRLARLCGRKLS